MAKVTQFCVGMEDKPGVLAKMCGVLRKAGVTIDALFVTNDADGCWVNMIAVPQEQVDQTLSENGYHFFTEQVLALEGEDRAGVLEEVSTKLAEAKVNINYVYGATAGTGRFALVVNVSDVERARTALEM